MLHDDGCTPHALSSHRESERSSVVHGRRTEVDALVREAEEHSEHRSDCRGGFVEQLTDEWFGDALGLTRRSRRIQHVEAGNSIRQRVCGLRYHGILVALITSNGAVEHETKPDVGSRGKDFCCLIGLVFRGDERLRPAIVDDVGKFLTGESRRCSGIDQTREVATPQDFQIAIVVLQAQRNVVAWLKTDASEQLGESVGGVVQLLESLGVSGAGHDEGCFVRCRKGMNSDVHGPESSAGTLGHVESTGDSSSALLQHFEELVTSGPTFALDEAFFTIAAHLHRGVTVLDQLVRLDEIASQVTSPTVEGVVRHLFGGENPFRGNHMDYYDPLNSLLDAVLDRRLGIPISLSVLTIEVGRRIGVHFSGVAMPGHFLVGVAAELGRIPDLFVDPFHGGTIFDIEGCRELFLRIAGRQAEFDPRFVAAVHPLAILDRALSNLKALYSSSQDLGSLRRVMALRARIPGIGKVEADEFRRLMAPLN